jgi:hypothetical protein
MQKKIEKNPFFRYNMQLFFSNIAQHIVPSLSN